MFFAQSPPSRRRLRLGVTAIQARSASDGTPVPWARPVTIAGSLVHASRPVWHGGRDPLRRGVPRLASGAFMGLHPSPKAQATGVFFASSPPSRRRLRLGVTAIQARSASDGTPVPWARPVTIAGSLVHASRPVWHGGRDPLRRGVPRLASGAFMRTSQPPHPAAAELFHCLSRFEEGRLAGSLK